MCFQIRECKHMIKFSVLFAVALPLRTMTTFCLRWSKFHINFSNKPQMLVKRGILKSKSLSSLSFHKLGLSDSCATPVGKSKRRSLLTHRMIFLQEKLLS